MKIRLLPLLLALSTGLLAQTEKKEKKLSTTTNNALSFRGVGPAFTSGRVADIAVNPNNTSEYYVAAASGGVWKTQNHGTTFTSVFDDQSSYSIGCVTISPHNTNEIWVGSGENNNQRSVGYGDGVYKSTDGGKSWKNVGLKSSEHIGMIAIHPENPNTIYVAAYGPLWSSGGERGIYKSENGGESWNKILDVSEHTGFNEIHIHPTNPDVLYATAHQRRRHVWTYVSGGPESALYKSTNGGKDWTKLENGLPDGDKGRIGIAIPPKMPNRIYAMIEGHGTYRSDNNGASFSKLNDHESSGNYYVELVADPVNPDKVYSMETFMKVSTDAGKSWQNVPDNDMHVDHHCLWINPKNNEQMIVGNDGGLYETYDGASNWSFKPNLPITQFYKVSLSNDEPFYYIYGGTQDNFSLGGPSNTINQHGISNSDWFVTNTGDGFETQVDPMNPNIIYAQSQYGGLVRLDRESGESIGISPMPLNLKEAYRYNWDAPLLISPHNNKTLYFAANRVFKSTDMGNNWKVISPDLSQQVDRHTLPVMGKIQSVDAISYDRSTTNYGNITALDESPIKAGLLYVGTDDGLIQISEDGGANWRKVQSFSGVPANTYVNQITASPLNENVVFAAFNNHKNGDFKPYLLKSTDKGKTWTNISSNLPERGSVYCVLQDHISENLLFTGTEFGVFYSIDGGSEWIQLKSGLPTVGIRDMAIHKGENDLVLGTFGRGFYVLDDYSLLRSLNKDVIQEDFTVFPASSGLVYEEASPLGYPGKGFQGASYYTAPNAEQGVAIYYFLKKAPKSLKSKRQSKEKELLKAKQSLTYPHIDSLRAEDREEKSYLLFVIIDDESKNEVRRFTKSASSGFNRVYWDGRLSSNVDNNDRNAPLTNANTMAFALPGRYFTEVYLFENEEAKKIGTSASFELKWLNKNPFVGDREEVLAFQQSIEAARKKYTYTEKLLKKLKNENVQISANVRNTPGADLSQLKALRQKHISLLNMEVRLYGDPALKERYFETPPSLANRLYNALYNSYYTTTAPTQQLRSNIELVDTQMDEITAVLEEIQSAQDAIQRKVEKAGGPAWID